MTLRYAEIANRTVADEYFAATANRPNPPTQMFNQLIDRVDHQEAS